MDVLRRIGPEVDRVFVVDDACPEGTGDVVTRECADPRVTVIRHEQNRGVGGATKTGYRAALAEDMDVVVKVDGDGQMDPAFVPTLVRSIAAGSADYTKGNRFYDLELLRGMPRVRLFGNAMLSLVNKAASGYWDVMDPTNGYTAIHRRRFRCCRSTSSTTVTSSSRTCCSASRRSARSSRRADGRTLRGRAEQPSRRARRRFVSCEIPARRAEADVLFLLPARLQCGVAAVPARVRAGGAGVGFGIAKWIESNVTGVPATPGTVMLAALPTLVAIQLLLSALHYDIGNVPREPLQARD
jgi:hypothetical protein